MAKVPPLQNVNVAGRTDLAGEKSVDLLGNVKSLLSGKTPNYEAACSLLMDLHLETYGAGRYDTVMKLLEEEIDSNVFSQLQSNYLEPSIEVMSRIDGADLVARRFNLEVSVRTIERLEQAGLMFYDSSSEPDARQRYPISLRYAGQWPATHDGKEAPTAMALGFDNDTVTIKIVETPEGIEVTNVNTDGSSQTLSIKIPVSEAVSGRVESSPDNYTPGTRYAVISRDDLAE